MPKSLHYENTITHATLHYNVHYTCRITLPPNRCKTHQKSLLYYIYSTTLLAVVFLKKKIALKDNITVELNVCKYMCRDNMICFR